jgi:hypothetical protein
VGYASGKTERLRNNDWRADDLIRIRTAEGLLADLCQSTIGIVGAMAMLRQLLWLALSTVLHAVRLSSFVWKQRHKFWFFPWRGPIWLK